MIEKPVPGQPLSEEQINYILDWATALKKSGKETAPSESLFNIGNR